MMVTAVVVLLPSLRRAARVLATLRERCSPLPRAVSQADSMVMEIASSIDLLGMHDRIAAALAGDSV